MADRLSESLIEAYLDEALPAAEMARIETELRQDATLLEQVASIYSRRDAGLHSLGEIWRRHRLTCPNREQLGSFLLGVLAPAHARYVEFHLDEVGCRLCRANLDDLRSQQAEAADAVQRRRRKYFQSSAGYLGRE